jgi:hypothetical protein
MDYYIHPIDRCCLKPKQASPYGKSLRKYYEDNREDQIQTPFRKAFK